MGINPITGTDIDASIRIHDELGPGVLEPVYEEILAYQLVKTGLFVKRQVPVLVIYEGLKMEMGFRADLIIEN